MSDRVSIEHVSYAYGRVRALTDVSVTAMPGKITAILGPNASGKSTLLRCVLGSLKPDQGVVTIDGQAAHRLSARSVASRMAYVPQRSSVSASFSVREVVELGRYALPLEARRVEDALERLDLTEVAQRIYSNLSVGQQQRVMMARAFAQLAPDGILLLDEPTSAMDLRHVSDSLAMVREVAAQGAVVLLIVHDLTLAASVADVIWVLQDGRLVGAGSVEEVMRPDAMESVFGVPFVWVETENRRRILLPEST